MRGLNLLISLGSLWSRSQIELFKRRGGGLLKKQGRAENGALRVAVSVLIVCRCEAVDAKVALAEVKRRSLDRGTIICC